MEPRCPVTHGTEQMCNWQRSQKAQQVPAMVLPTWQNWPLSFTVGQFQELTTGFRERLSRPVSGLSVGQGQGPCVTVERDIGPVELPHREF